MAVVVPLLSRPVYPYADVDRLVGLQPGTARRWINGYKRNGITYDPILRDTPQISEWVTWGEFVETRILAEYRDKDIPTQRLRGAVDALRDRFQIDYPLAHLRPYLAAEAGELAVDLKGVDSEDEQGMMLLRTGQLLLSAPSRAIMNYATIAQDERGEKFAAELAADNRFQGVVLNPDRHGGQPTFAGRRVAIATIAGMVEAGEPRAELAADYGLSLAQVDAAVEYAAAHALAA